MDITKCKGLDCPIKEHCYRYTSKADEYQSWFVDNPFEITNGDFKCDMYWGENSEQIFKQLNDIMNDNKLG